MKTKEQKRLEAQVRQEEHDGLTVQQKIAKAARRRGRSERELAKLGKALKEQK